jgi:hypothetical protein
MSRFDNIHEYDNSLAGQGLAAHLQEDPVILEPCHNRSPQLSGLRRFNVRCSRFKVRL